MNNFPSTIQQTTNNDNCIIQKQINTFSNGNNVGEKDKKKIVKNLPKPPPIVKSFQGRQTEIKRLDDLLFEEDKKTRVVTICGLPGFGKSELAKKFAQISKDKNKIECICWIQANTENKLHESFRDLAKLLNLPEVEDIRSLIQIITNWFRGTRTVFIIDDAENRQSLKDLEMEFQNPLNSDCYFVITSKEKDWDDDIPSIELNELQNMDAINVLKAIIITNSRVNNNDTMLLPLLENIAKSVECVPLALQIVAACIRQEQKELGDKFNLEDYSNQLLNYEDKFLSQEFPKNTYYSYEKCIAHAINISINKIHQSQSNLAVQILNMSAYFDSFFIPEQTIIDILYFQKKFENCRQDNVANEVRKALYLLDNYSLINFNSSNKSIKIHNLVQRTLIFYQNKDNIVLQYYLPCLEYILTDSSKRHLHFVLRYADKYFEYFPQFYITHKSNIISEKIFLNFEMKNPELPNFLIEYCRIIHTFLGALVVTKSRRCLTFILNDLKECAGEIINKYLLLYIAIRNNAFNAFYLMLRYGPDINITFSKENITLLQAAVEELNVPIIKLLLKKKININKSNNSDRSLFYHVFFPRMCQNFKIEDNLLIEIINLLHEIGANIRVSEEGITILHLAVVYNYIKLIDLITNEFNIDINITDNYGYTPLHYAIPIMQHAINNSIKTDVFNIRSIIYGKKNVNEHNMRWKDIKIQDKMTLHLLNSLVQKGADVHILTRDGLSVLHLAVLSKDVKLIEHIIENLDIDINIESKNGLTPLDIIFNEACKENDKNSNSKVDQTTLDVIRALVKKRGELHELAKNGFTILHLAVFMKDVELLEFIIDKLRVDSNIKNCNLHTPLDFMFCMLQEKHKKNSNSTIDKSSMDVISALIQRCAKLHDLAKKGYTILHFAVLLKDVKLIEFIVDELRENINIVNSEQETPFDFIFLKLYNEKSKSNNIIDDMTLEIIESLFIRSAKLHFLAKEGFTILHFAVFLENLKLVQFIVNQLRVNVNIQNNAGETPLQNLMNTKTRFSNNINKNIADSKDIRKITRFLKNRGANIKNENVTFDFICKIFQILLFVCLYLVIVILRYKELATL